MSLVLCGGERALSFGPKHCLVLGALSWTPESGVSVTKFLNSVVRDLVRRDRKGPSRGTMRTRVRHSYSSPVLEGLSGCE